MKKSIILFLSLSLMGLFGLSISANVQEAQASTISDAQKRKTLRVGFSSFVPWAMQNNKGQYIGFEIDVATRLAKDLGLKYQPVPTAWSGIIPALLTNKVDVIIGGMGITPERLEQVDFTIPYDESRLEIMANKENSAKLKTVKDFNNKNVVIVARLGASPALAAKEMFPKAEIRQFNDEGACIEEVLSGRANAFIASSPLASFSIADNPDKLFTPFEITEYREPIAFAVKKGDTETLEVFNAWIEKVKAEGWLDERVKYWFGSKEWEKDL